jgi:hypothetical protein
MEIWSSLTNATPRTHIPHVHTLVEDTRILAHATQAYFSYFSANCTSLCKKNTSQTQTQGFYRIFHMASVMTLNHRPSQTRKHASVITNHDLDHFATIYMFSQNKFIFLLLSQNTNNCNNCYLRMSTLKCHTQFLR